MKMKILTLLILTALILPLFATPASTLADTGDPVLINEVLASHSGTDNTEFVEFYGIPGTSLSGLSLIVVEGDAFGPGSIDRRFDFKPFHQIGPNGFFLFGNCSGLGSNYSVTPDASLFNNYFENSSLTVALVETASITGDSVSGSEIVLDTVALTDGDPDDVFYFDAPVIGPDGEFFPAGARRIVDGEDTNTPDDWVIASFFIPGDNTPMGGGFDGCAPIPLTIPEIQGDGQFSDYQGEVATTEGVVTLVSANGRDMWIQDLAGDGNPATSDGIFVDDRNRLPDPKPQVGDLVRVTADVEELQFGNALPLTQLNNPDDYPFEILSSGNPLPAPVSLVDLPNLLIQEGIDFWEPLEGMLVMIENGFVVFPTNRFGEFVMLTENDADADLMSGYYAQTKQIFLVDLEGNEVDYNPERIMVDDTSLSTPIQVMPGDRVRSLTGVVDYTFGNYKLQPASYELKTHKLPKMPASTRSGDFGDTTITTFNVENLFDLVDNPDKDDEGSTPSPDELETKLTKLAMAFEIEMGLPPLVVVQEVENTEVLTGDENGFVPGSSIPALLPRLPGSWDAVSFETSDGRGIEVAFVWNTDKVSVLDAYQMSGPDVEAWFGPTSPSPGREPLVGVFEIQGKTITIIGNHFKSKGGDDPLFGVNWPPIRITEVQRKGQAMVVRDFVDTILNADPNALVMVAGDLNDFQFGEPGEGEDHPLAILEGYYGGVPLTNLINLEKPAERFTYLFDGNSQVLDHILVSPALLDYFVAVDVLHFNASFPAAVGEHAGNALHASDHDPVEARFSFKLK